MKSTINGISSALNIESNVVVDNHSATRKSQQELNTMHKIVDETDNDLRHILEQASVRHEQLDELHFRSQEMLNKNENLVFGITNYRKNQERDILWRRVRYGAFGAITIGIIILLIILSMVNKRSTPASQVISIRNFNGDSTSTMKSTSLRRVRRRKRYY